MGEALFVMPMTAAGWTARKSAKWWETTKATPWADLLRPLRGRIPPHPRLSRVVFGEKSRKSPRGELFTDSRWGVEPGWDRPFDRERLAQSEG